VYDLVKRHIQGEENVIHFIYLIRYLQISRETGSPDAAYTLAMLKLDESSHGYIIDCPNPLETIQKLAKSGHSQSMINMGHFYMFGKYGLPKDRDKAIDYYEKAIASKCDDIQVRPHLLKIHKSRN